MRTSARWSKWVSSSHALALAVGLALTVLPGFVAATAGMGRSSADLLQRCKLAVQAADKVGMLDAVDFAEAANCHGYLGGVGDALSATYGGMESPVLCVPAQAGSLQLARVFVKWGDEHPELLHEDMLSGTLRALSLAFPCQARPG